MEKDLNIKQIEEFFRAPERVADKVQNVAERVRGGYVLMETRPNWDGSPSSWSKLPVTKIIYHKPSESWRLYWMRASGRWERYPTKAKTFNSVLKVVKEDQHGCFWG